MNKNIFILIIIQNLLFFSYTGVNASGIVYEEVDELLEMLEEERIIREIREQIKPDSNGPSEKEVEPIVQKLMQEDIEPSLVCLENSLQKIAQEQAGFHSKINKLPELLATLALFASSNKIGMLKSQLITVLVQALLPYLNTSLASNKCSFKLDRKLIKEGLIEMFLSADSYSDERSKYLKLGSHVFETLYCNIKPEIEILEDSNQGYILKDLNHLKFNMSPLGQVVNDFKADTRLQEHVAPLCGGCSDSELIPLNIPIIIFVKSGCFTEGLRALFCGWTQNCVPK